MDARAVRLVLLTAGAGYGKSTVLTQWAAVDARPFAWLSLSVRHNDPVVLLTELAEVFLGVDPMVARSLGRLGSSGADVSSVQLPRLARIIERCPTPFVLALDDVHHVSARQAVGAIRMLADSIPTGSQLALAGRVEPAFPLGAMRARGALLTLNFEDLAMGVDDATLIMGAAGVELDRWSVETLVDRTEGWPVALYLAAIALQDASDPEEVARRFGGDDGFVVDYLRDELFTMMSADSSAFLARTSVLDELSGDLCDAVL